MIKDLELEPNALPAKTDICIVGSGPAGISVALRLQQKRPSATICLLEGGSRNPSQFSQSLYQGSSIGMPFDPLEATRLRAFGGSSGHWSGWCTPFPPSDFKTKSWIPDSGWPIDYSELQPYYRDADEFFKLNYLDYFNDAVAEFYPELQVLDSTRVKPTLWQHSWPPMNVARNYLEKLESAKSITVYLNANLTNIELEPTGKTISHLKVTHNDGIRKHTISAKLYVIACGGIENPRILLTSNDVSKAGIGNDNDTVGRFYMDHLQTNNATVIGMDRNKLKTYLDRRNKPFISLGLAPSEKQQTKSKIASSVGYFSYFRESSPQLDHAKSVQEDLRRNRITASTIRDGIFALRELDTLVASVVHKRKNNNDPDQDSIPALRMYTEQVPHRDSRIILSNDRDSLGVRRARMDWKLTELDYQSIRKSTKIIGSELARLNMGRLKYFDWLVPETASWPNYIISANHHMGTTRMSDSQTTGVVNTHCRVHGIDNLYMAGSSVFPTGGYANPTLTIVALSIRLADHLSTKFSYIR